MLLLIFFLESEEGRERKREKHQCESHIDGLPPVLALTSDLTHNLGACPAQELNHNPFDAWTMLRPTESPGQGEAVVAFVLQTVSSSRHRGAQKQTQLGHPQSGREGSLPAARSCPAITPQRRGGPAAGPEGSSFLRTLSCFRTS